MFLKIVIWSAWISATWASPVIKSLPEADLCTSEECIGVSYRILKNMDLTADPCEDFYQFTCGKFMVESRIPDDRTSISAFEPVEDNIYEQGRNLLEDEQSEGDFDSYQLARNHYKACINEEKIEEVGVQPLKDKLKDLGGWPVVEEDQWQGENFTWWNWTYSANEAGLSIDTILDFSISADDKNTSWRVLKLDQADLGLSREYLVKGFDDKDVQHYFRYMVEIAVLLGAKKEQAENELKESLQFEIDLATISSAREERRNANELYNPTTLNKVPTGPGLPPSWPDFFRRIFSFEGTVQIDENERVIVARFEYIDNLSELLNKTNKRTIANYQAWRLVKEVVPLLNDEARRIRHKYRKALTGVQAVTPTWKRCVEEVGFNSFETSNFIYVINSMYVRKYFNKDAKKEMIDMASYIRKSFEDEILKELDWMDDAVKDRARKKLKLMDEFIAYSEEYLDKEKIDEMHKGIEVTTDDLFGNSLRLYQFWRKIDLRKYREQIDRRSWKEHYYIALVNALYIPDNNYMEFPAGILQGAFFTPKAPKYINFGAIGTIIGHEITHGFDDEGKQRNELGEIENWWDPETESKYHERAKCMIDQYSNYLSKQVNMTLDGVNNQGENIADNGGVKEAYFAYLKWASENEKEPRLPGLLYSPRQMFWISFSQLWCTKYQDEALKEQILTDYHAPGEFRIIGTLSNNADFAKDFNCPVGSAMNPEKKCSVW